MTQEQKLLAVVGLLPVIAEYENFKKLKEQHDLILIKNQTSTTKKCSKCNEVKLKNKFQKGKRVCNNCRYKQQRNLVKSKK